MSYSVELVVESLLCVVESPVIGHHDPSTACIEVPHLLQVYQRHQGTQVSLTTESASSANANPFFKWFWPSNSTSQRYPFFHCSSNLQFYFIWLFILVSVVLHCLSLLSLFLGIIRRHYYFPMEDSNGWRDSCINSSWHLKVGDSFCRSYHSHL